MWHALRLLLPSLAGDAAPIAPASPAATTTAAAGSIMATESKSSENAMTINRTLSNSSISIISDNEPKQLDLSSSAFNIDVESIGTFEKTDAIQSFPNEKRLNVERNTFSLGRLAADLVGSLLLELLEVTHEYLLPLFIVIWIICFIYSFNSIRKGIVSTLS
jgi:hypothetical protein